MTANDTARVFLRHSPNARCVVGPSTLPWLDPVVIQRTMEEVGAIVGAARKISRSSGARSPCSLSSSTGWRWARISP